MTWLTNILHEAKGMYNLGRYFVFSFFVRTLTHVSALKQHRKGHCRMLLDNTQGWSLTFI